MQFIRQLLETEESNQQAHDEANKLRETLNALNGPPAADAEIPFVLSPSSEEGSVRQVAVSPPCQWIAGTEGVSHHQALWDSMKAIETEDTEAELRLKVEAELRLKVEAELRLKVEALTLEVKARTLECEGQEWNYDIMQDEVAPASLHNHKLIRSVSSTSMS